MSKTLLPASIICTLCDFSTLEFRGHKTINIIINIYCCLVTALHLTFRTVHIIVKVLKPPVTLVSVMFLLVDIASTVTLFYYRGKLLTAKEVMKNIFNKIDLIIGRLYSLGVNESNKKKPINLLQLHVYNYGYKSIQVQICMLFWTTYLDSLRPDLSLSLIHI